MGMTTADRKKRIEKYYLEEARRASSIFPGGELVSHENPDFLMRLDNGTLGVEVTELCREEPRAEAARLAKIPEEAKALYNRFADSEPVDVSLAFSRYATDLTFKELTNSLVKFVHAHHKSKGTSPSRDWPRGYCHIGMHAPFEQIDPTGRWHSIRAFHTVIAPKELVESRIAEKNARLVNYRRAATEVWLLIINDQFLGPGEVCTRPDRLAEWKFSFDFEKVLMFAREPGGGGEVLELQQM